MSNINNFDELYQKINGRFERGQKIQGFVTAGNIGLSIGVALMVGGLSNKIDSLKMVGIILWVAAAILYMVALIYICTTKKQE